MVKPGHKHNTEAATRHETVLAEVVTLGLLLGVALALRLYMLDKSLWLDEVITCRHAGRSIVDVLHRSAPLYMLLMHFWLPFSSSEILLRLPSLLFGLAGIACTYGLARRVSGPAAAFVAGFLMVVSPFHVEHSQDARYYTLVALTSVLTAWALRSAVNRGGTWRWAAVVAVSGAGIANHLIFIPFLIAMMTGAGLAALVKQRYKALGALVLCGLALVAGFVPVWIRQGNIPSTMVQGVFADKQPASSESAEKPAHAVEAQPEGLIQSEGLRVSQYVQFCGELFGKLNPTAVATLIVLGLLGAAWLLARRVTTAAIILAAILLAPIPLFLLPATHFYAARYFMPLLPLFAVAVGAGVCALGDGGAALAHRLRKGDGPYMISAGQALASITALTILGLSAYGSLGRYYDETPRWDWKGLVRETTDRLRPGDAIVYVRPDALEWTTDWCADFYRERYQTSAGLALIEPERLETPEELEEFARSHPNAAIWVVGAHYEPLLPATIGSEFAPLLARLGASRRDYGQATLYCIPGPTANLIAGGDFEDPAATRPTLCSVSGNGGIMMMEDIRGILSSEAFEGNYAVRLDSPTANGRQPNLLFDIPGYAEWRCRGPLVFSAMVKHDNITTLKDPRLVAEIVLVAAGRDGVTWKTLKRIENSRGWHLVAAAINADEDTSSDTVAWKVGFAFNDSAGTLWLDNVQLQEGELPSPFVNGARAPHDVVLWDWSSHEAAQPSSP